MVILEPDGTVDIAACGSHPEAAGLLTELVAAANEALHHTVHYAFDVPGIGMVALEVNPEMIASAFHAHRFGSQRGLQDQPSPAF